MNALVYGMDVALVNADTDSLRDMALKGLAFMIMGSLKK